MSSKKVLLKFDKSAEGYPAILIGLAWSAYPLLYYIGIFADKIGIGSVLLISLLFMFFSIKSFHYLASTVRITDFLYLSIFIGVFLATYLIHPENKEYLDNYIGGFFIAILYFLVGRVYSDHEMRETLTLFSYISIAAMSFYVLFWGKQTGSLEESDDSMFASYMILPHVLMALLSAFKNHSFIGAVFSVIGVFLVLAFGTRGPLICILVFCAALFVFLVPFKRKVLSRILLLGALLFIYLMFDRILLFFRDLIASIGMSTRIMDYYEMGMISDDSGRDEIRQVIIGALRDNPFSGLGICGDWRVAGVYSHNIILEFISSFGVLIGSILLLLLLVCYCRGFLSCQSTEQKEVLLLFIICGFVKLLMSGTFVTESFFYFAIGYSVTLIRHRNRSLPNYQIE